MDRSWIDCNRTSKAYLDGVESFFSFAFANKDANADIYCLCSKCVNHYCYTLPIVWFHVNEKGFCKGYEIWTYHGQNAMGGLYGTTDNKVDDLTGCNVSGSNPMADMIAMIHEGRGFPIMEDDTDNDYPAFEDTTEPFGSENAFYKRLQEVEMPLYEDCPEVTELSFIVQLLHMKQLNGSLRRLFSLVLSQLSPKPASVPAYTNCWGFRKILLRTLTDTCTSFFCFFSATLQFSVQVGAKFFG